MADNEVPKEVLLDGAQMMIAATVTGIISFLKEKNIPIGELVNYMGEAFEGSFGALEGAGVDDVMEHFLTLQILPIGAEVIESHGSDEKAEVTLTQLPPANVLGKFGTTPAELLEGFGVTEEEYESTYEMYRPAFSAIGLKYEHTLRDGKEIISLEKS